VDNSKMHLPIERFIGVMADYSIVYLIECEQCGVLIAYQGQGHSCDGIIDESEQAKWEASYLAEFMKGLKKVFTLKKFEGEQSM
jgi:hypothetical protein